MQIRHFVFPAILSASLAAQQPSAPPVALTIYNQDFAVARTSIDLNLHAGVNEVTTTGVTSQLEPDSVVLSDPSGKSTIHILEQNYDAGVVNQDWLLKKYEGKTIDFLVGRDMNSQKEVLVQGRIIRAGGEPGQQQSQPLIEVDGHMQFMLPGTPLFPVSTDGLLLQPTLRWQIEAQKPEHIAAELAYITGGLDWEATYNVVVPQSQNVTGEEKAEVVGWVTIHNQCGSDFPRANIKLMAGDVAKIVPQAPRFRALSMAMVNAGAPQVTQKAFDDFHLYDLHRTVALRDGETKQVEFLDAANVGVERSYVYDGAAPDLEPIYPGNLNQQQGFGLDANNTKVRIVEAIKNSEANHLGMPLPAGRLRVYRRDSDGQMEFVGESMIGHTPAEDTVKITTGDAFDIKGSRKQTDFEIEPGRRGAVNESFEIRLTNQKEQPVKVMVVEHLYRGDNWEIVAKSADFIKQDSHTIEFPLQVPAKGDATLTYSVRYTW